MPFHFLIDELPDTIGLSDSKNYKVNVSFKNILLILQLMDEECIEDEIKINLAISKFYVDETPKELFLEAHRKMIDFISCYSIDTKAETKTNSVKTLDFIIDGQSIWAAFLQLYQINLRTTELHWFEFMALLNNLNGGEPQIVSTIQLRGMKDTDMKMYDHETQVKIRKARKKVALTNNYDERAKTFDVLANIARGKGGEEVW